MINENLIDNPEIARLKLQIEKFKKYDAERKKYYSNALVRLGQLTEFFEELDNCKDHPYRKIKNLKTEVNRLRLIIEHSKLEDSHDPNTLIRYSLELKNRDLNKQVSVLTKKIQKLTKENKELVNRIINTKKIEN